MKFGRKCKCGVTIDYRAGSCRACRKLTPEQLRENKRQSFRRWREKNIEYARARVLDWKAKNPNHHARHTANKRSRWTDERRRRHTLETVIRQAIKRGGGVKAARVAELLGCGVPEFMRYIEGLWLPGMSWDNWGNTLHHWQLDHIRPVSSFDLRDPVQQAACFHFSNYQPLWKLDNVRKGAAWDAHV